MKPLPSFIKKFSVLLIPSPLIGIIAFGLVMVYPLAQEALAAILSFVPIFLVIAIILYFTRKDIRERVVAYSLALILFCLGMLMGVIFVPLKY